MKVYYGRVSTEQEDQRTSIERQIADGKRLKCDRILIDKDSGRSDDRPQYQALINMIKLGEVTEVFASRDDRLNRNQYEMQYFYNLCLEFGVKWFFTDVEGLDWDSSFGESIRRQKAYEAEQESLKLARRQEKAYEHAEREGKAIARKCPLGYRINKDRKYEIDWILPDFSNAVGFCDGKHLGSGELARRLVDEFLKHQSLRSALKHWKDFLRNLDTSRGQPEKVKAFLNFAGSSFHDWLKHPVLRGHTAYGRFKRVRYGEKLDKHKYVELPAHEWRITWNTHPNDALISDVEWSAIQRILEANQVRGYAIAKSRLKPGTPASLSTILRCKHCNRRFLCSSTTQEGKMYRYYYCGGKRDHYCITKSIPETELVNQLLDALVLKAKEMVILIEGSEANEIQADPEQLKVLRQKAQEAEQNYRLTDMKEFKDLAQKLNQRITEIELTRLRIAEQAESNLAMLQGLSNRRYWDSLPRFELHKNLRDLVHNCWIENGKVVLVEFAL